MFQARRRAFDNRGGIRERRALGQEQLNGPLASIDFSFGTLWSAEEMSSTGEETCHKHLPLVGSVVEVPCEARSEDDTSDAYAPKISCDELAGLKHQTE
jgi:hypothetical protein